MRFNYVFVGDRLKPIILFLHGFMGSGADFQACANLLQGDFCCLLVDLPGHGKTEVSNDTDYLMPEVAQAIIELLEQLGIEQCFLVGYSMGGRLALYLTIYFPQYFIKAVLESASPGLSTKIARDNRIKRDLVLANKVETQEFELFLEQWYGNPLFTSFKKHPNYQQAIALRRNNDPNKLAKSLRYMGLGMQPYLGNDLKFDRVPLLLIVGELDFKFVEINRKLDRLSLKSSLMIVRNSGHNVHFEQSFQFARLLVNFCQQYLNK